jgi:hypothetical protein
LEPEADLLETIFRWDRLSRWERAEVGRALRRLGWTYSEIMEWIPVPKGTLAGWCCEIRLTADQVAAIRARRPAGVRTGIPVDTQRKRRQQVARIREAARLEVPHFVDDALWVAGTVLYWAEGVKALKRLELGNSDPRALRLFLSWVRRFHDADACFTVALNMHAGNDEPAARLYWTEQLGLDDYMKTYIKPDGTGHRKNHLAFGVCRVRMRASCDAWHRTMAWIERLAEELGVSACN